MTNYIIYKDGRKEEITHFAKHGDTIRFTTISGRFVYVPSGMPAKFLKEEIIAHKDGTVSAGMILYDRIDTACFVVDTTFEYTMGPISGEVTIPEDTDIEQIHEAIFQDAIGKLSRFIIYCHQKGEK